MMHFFVRVILASHVLLFPTVLSADRSEIEIIQCAQQLHHLSAREQPVCHLELVDRILLLATEESHGRFRQCMISLFLCSVLY